MYSSSSMALQLRPKCRSISTPTFVQLFSSSSSSSDPNGTNSTENNTATSPPPPQTPQPPPPPPPPSSSESKPSYSSHFSDVKSSLKQQQQQQPKPTWQQPRRPSLSRESPPSKIASLEEIRKNLHEFRRRAAAPSSAETNRGTSPQPISFQELYKRNLNEKPQQSPVEAAPGKSGPGSGKFSFEAIRESLRHMRNTSGNVDQKGSDSMPLSAFRNSLKLSSVDQNKGSWSSRIGGESEKLPASIFGKEMRQRNEGSRPVSTAMKTEFVKIYSYKELGEKLRQLRPEGKVEEKNWFSLGELNERLVKLRENEENETKSSNISGVSFNDLRDSLLTLKMSDDEKAKRSTIQRLDVLSHFGSTPSFMLDPPKEQLVEKFFHPDNMSSAEKMKIELQKVRDEFKMSESDCGSARVQVAQLTTKIKHLSTALHKKDKHSRKGLQEMVQKRKKLLKYLRRTDWESYCFVLSRLGLRDNPGYKAT